MLSREVRRRKINHLLAFIGNGDAGNNDVAIAGVQRGKDAFPRCIYQLDLEAFGLGDGLDDINIKAFQLFAAVFEFERTIGAAGADDVSGFCRQSRSRQGGGQAGANQNYAF
ncbi:hypothetical protein D3C81_1694840 [compost metagenome]